MYIYIYIDINVYSKSFHELEQAKRYRVAKMHKMPQVAGLFS